MQKGENAISAALAAVVVLVFIAAHQRWQLAGFQRVAASAEEYLLATTGIRGQTPDLPGFEKLKTYALGSYQASLYRQSPTPLTFAAGRLVIYDLANRPVFKMNTLEGSREAWTTVYDFAGRNGRPIPGRRAKPKFTLDLNGDGTLDALIGIYSGGDHCCTVATVIEIGKESVRELGRIGGINGLPFEGLEVRKIDADPAWEFIAHERYRTLCGAHEDSPEVLSIYDYVGGQWTNQTVRHVEFLRTMLQQDIRKWNQTKLQSLQLLQSIAAQHAALGEREVGRRFFAMNLNVLLPAMREKGVDLNACLEDATGLLARIPSVVP